MRDGPHAQLWVAVGWVAGIVHHLILVEVRVRAHWRVAVAVGGLVWYGLIHHGVVVRHHVLGSAWVGIEVGPCFC